MTINEAIIQVMRQAGRPLSAKEAYESIVRAKLYTFHAQRPENVVKSQIRRHCGNLDFPSAQPAKYFEMTPDGKFIALDSPTRGRVRRGTKRGFARSRDIAPTLGGTVDQLKRLSETHRALVKRSIVRDLKKVSPLAFEKFAKRLLEVYGFEEMQVTSVTKDGGIDGHGRLKVGLARMDVAFQCKRWTDANVGRTKIDEFRGAIQGEYAQGIFFTTSGFAAGAREVSIKKGAVPVVLIDGEGIADLMIEKRFGVEAEAIPLLTYALDSVLE